MSKKQRKNRIELGKFNPCPKCGKLMQHYGHKEITAKMLQQPYYYSEWDRCWGCRHMQMYKEFIVPVSIEMRKASQFEEDQQQLFKNL